MSPSPAKSSQPWALLGERAEFTSPVERVGSIGKSVVNSNVSLRIWTGRFSVTNEMVFGTIALPPKSWMLFVAVTTSSALSGNSPKTGDSVTWVVNWSCFSVIVERTRRAGVVAVPLPHSVGVAGAASKLGTKPATGSPVAYWKKSTVFSLTVQGFTFSLNVNTTLLLGPTNTGAAIAAAACG